MKQRLLSLLLLLTGVMQSVCAQEPYAVLSDDNKTLTFYYDINKESRGGMSCDYPLWNPYTENITTVVFDNSFANCTTLTNTSSWFQGCENLTTITGIEYLKTSNVTDMSWMFYGCSGLTSLNLNNFDTSNVTNMHSMFSECSSQLQHKQCDGYGGYVWWLLGSDKP